MARLEGSRYVGEIGWRLHEVLDCDIVVPHTLRDRAAGIRRGILVLLVRHTGAQRSGETAARLRRPTVVSISNVLSKLL